MAINPSQSSHQRWGRPRAVREARPAEPCQRRRAGPAWGSCRRWRDTGHLGHGQPRTRSALSPARSPGHPGVVLVLTQRFTRGDLALRCYLVACGTPNPGSPGSLESAFGRPGLGSPPRASWLPGQLPARPPRGMDPGDRLRDLGVQVVTPPCLTPARTVSGSLRGPLPPSATPAGRHPRRLLRRGAGQQPSFPWRTKSRGRK